MYIASNKGQWDGSALGCLFASSRGSTADHMIELRSSCGEKVMVHKVLLCHYSPYYDAAINGAFQESKSEHFELGINRVYAQKFTRWLYSGELGDQLSSPDAHELVELYIFADRVDILALRRKIMTEIVLKTGPGMKLKDFLTYQSIALITRSLLPSSPLYNYAVEWYTEHYPHGYDDVMVQKESDFEEVSREFLLLVICKFASRAESKDGAKKTPCKCCYGPCHYHEHDSENDWFATCRMVDDFKFMDYPDGLEYPQPKHSST